MSEALAWLRPRFDWTGVQRLGWGAWTALIAIVTAMAIAKPLHRTVTQVYHQAALAWWAEEPLYGAGIGGFLYLPSFALLYSPFAGLGPVAGDIVWRIVSFAALTFAVWRLSRQLLPADAARLAPLVLLLMIPGVADMVRNGQATTLMTALMVLAAAETMAGRRIAPGIALALAIVVKPIAIVMALLWAVLYRRCAPALAAAMMVLLLLPFAAADFDYVAAQYSSAWAKLTVASDPGPGGWADITGILATLGLSVGDAAMTAVRAAAALATLGLGAVALARLPRRDGTLIVFALAICYLMLFNPRTESNTYGTLAVAMAAFAGPAWLAGGLRGRALWLTAGCIALGSNGYGNLAIRLTQGWFKPVLCLIFLAMVVAAIRQRAVAGLPPAATTGTRARD